jgi:hypothetical protein
MASDPRDDPIGEIRRVREDEDRRRAESAARSEEYGKFQLLWERAGLLMASPEEFAALGEQLRKRGYEFWIEFSLLVVRREHEVRKLDRPSHRAVRQRAIGQFILAACRGEELGERLIRLTSCRRPPQWQRFQLRRVSLTIGNGLSGISSANGMLRIRLGIGAVFPSYSGNAESEAIDCSATCLTALPTT